MHRAGRMRRWAVGVASIAVVALASGVGAQGRPGGTTSPPGTIVVDGSSTVAPITSAIAEEFVKTPQGRGVRITVGVSGTGGGFKKFCADSPQSRTDISNASRPIQATEDEACRRHQVSYTEVPVGIDGLAVVVHPRNTWATCLTAGELRRIWEPAAERQITTWRQVRRSFPDRPLRLAGPGADSGTFDSFTEVIVGKAKSSRGDYQASEDDNVLVQFVQRDEGALGYFGLAYLEENLGRIKGVAIDPSDKVDLTSDSECQGVGPTFENVLAGRYRPLTRPLFIYVNRVSAQTKPEVRTFVNYYIGPDGVRRQVDDPRTRGAKTPLIRAVGYVEFPAEVYTLAARCFAMLRAGTAFTRDGRPAGSASVGDVVQRYRQRCR
ncbi:MAG: PstS family phosphate ABC transporter substrate-binding protein [Armatimonadota bacterium]|nr:PstS family phosphate ABC transporter substrate-binding protein [Armatimonadota bacterium]MDR5698047.1 PstS family phosphate ABC transporter substrate-binding protein [Armatimonadota bacterium]